MSEPLADNVQSEPLEKNCFEGFVEFEKLLVKYAQLFSQAVEKGGQTNDVPALMINSALAFGQRTIQAIQILLRETKNALFPCILCRPYYELAIRLLWAARKPNGWQRLQAYLATEDERWSKEAVKMPEFAAHAQQVLGQSQEVLSRTDRNGNPYTVAPSVQQMLREIEKLDVSEGLRQEGGNVAAYEYTNVYRIMCRPAHAHVQAISLMGSASFFAPTVFATGLATFGLLRSIYHVVAKDPAKEVSGIATEIVCIMKKSLGSRKKDSDN